MFIIFKDVIRKKDWQSVSKTQTPKASKTNNYPYGKLNTTCNINDMVNNYSKIELFIK